MRYIADSNGMIRQISFGADITCNGETCVEYTGAVPSPYFSLESWYETALKADQMCYWKIVDGDLTWDPSVINKRTDFPLNDWVVEQGEKDGWTYRIWANGEQECWYSGQTESLDTTGLSFQSGFYYSNIGLKFPYPFASPPAVVVDGGSDDILNFLRVSNVLTDTANILVMSIENTDTDTVVNYHAYAKGKAISNTTAVLGKNILGRMRLGEGE